MPVANIDVTDGLINGAREEITHTVATKNHTVIIVLFDNQQIGIKAI